MASARNVRAGRSSLLRTRRRRLASDSRSALAKFEIRSRYFRRINHYATGAENCEWSAPAQLDGQDLRDNLRVETRVSLEQGTNSRRISESQQLRQSSTRSGSSCARLLREICP